MAFLKTHDRAQRASSNIPGAMLCGLILPLLFVGCPGNDRSNNSQPSATASPGAASPASPPGVEAFNGERALEHVKKQVEIGPRVPGSPELAKTREYIIGSLKSSGLNVTTDDFQATTPIGERKMVNITAEVPGESKEVIIISSHYDTKYFKVMRFVGANDPGASVGALLELGRALGALPQKPKFTYWLVFFDGEESFCNGWDECQNPNPADATDPLPDNTYGSRRYVVQLQKNSELARVRAMILLDMMGYKNLELGRDTMSTRWLQDIVWRTARDLGHGNYFVDRPEGVGGDDHEPFLRAGVPSVDLIQLSGYPHWHRADDTLDKISAQSLKIVGEAVLASLPPIEKYLQSKPASH